MPYLLVDGGNLLFNRPRVDITGQQTVRVETMAAVYQEMGYDGVAVGPYDLAAGLDIVLQAGMLGVPWISANLTDQAGTLLFAPYRSLRVGALRIAVIGLTAEDASPQSGDYLVIPAKTAIAGLLDDVTGDHDLIIVLSNGATAQTTRLAEDFPAIDLIIGADRKHGSVPPFLANNAVIMQCGNRGMSLGFFKAHWTGQPWGFDPEQERARLMERLASLSWQISRLKSQKQLDQTASSRKMEALLDAQQQAEAELLRLTESLATRANTAEPSTFLAQLMPLGNSIADDPIIRDLIDQGKQRAVERSGTP